MQSYKTRTSSTTTEIHEKMASSAPIAIGTRGTVGALVRKEIEYFNKLELDPHGSSRKPRGSVHVHHAAAAWPSLRFFLVSPWKRKKHRSCSTRSSFLPSMCSVSEVAERNRAVNAGIPGFSYRVLGDDMINSNLEV